jgi:hypothetical protein
VKVCSADADCRPLGPTAACLYQSCRIPQPEALVNGVAPACDDRLKPLQQQVAAAVAAADRSCQQDSDCVNVSASNRCLGGGCPLTYVSKTGGAAIDALLEKLDAQDCDTIFRAGCVLPPGRHGCPTFGAPACVNGACTGRLVGVALPDASAD